MTEYNVKHKPQETFPPVSGFMSVFCQASRNVTNAEMFFFFFFKLGSLHVAHTGL